MPSTSGGELNIKCGSNPSSASREGGVVFSFFSAPSHDSTCLASSLGLGPERRGAAGMSGVERWVKAKGYAGGLLTYHTAANILT